MTGPRAQSFYCITETSLSDNSRIAYGVLSIVCASIGFFGSAHLVMTFRKVIKLSRKRRSVPNPSIMFFLALSDLITCFALILRTVLFFIISPPQIHSDGSIHPDNHLVVYIGAPVQFLVKAAFLATFMWSFCISLHVYLESHKIETPNSVYHTISWLTALWLSSLSDFVKFYQSAFKCANNTQLSISRWCLCVPIIFVMFANPVLYVLAYTRVKSDFRQHGVMSRKEHRHLSRVFWKFCLFVIVFWVCWTPSVIAGIYVQSLDDPTENLPIELWLTSSVFNPLQGFLNCLVYSPGRDVDEIVKLSLPERPGQPDTSTGRDSTRTPQERSGCWHSSMTSSQTVPQPKRPSCQEKMKENTPLLNETSQTNTSAVIVGV